MVIILEIAIERARGRHRGGRRAGALGEYDLRLGEYDMSARLGQAAGCCSYRTGDGGLW